LKPGTETPEFVAVGHVTHDLVNGEIRLGGAALYASVTASRLGKRAALFTSFGRDFQGEEVLQGIPACTVGAEQTSTFRNVYAGAERVQMVYGIADPLRVEDFPLAWGRAGIVYLCPVLHEVPVAMVERLPGVLLGVAPQGWMRTWDGEGRIRARRWEGFHSLLPRARCLVASEKDIEGNEDLVDIFRSLTPIVVITLAERGSMIYLADRTIEMGAYPAKEVDPTGAGDCFGAAFLIRLLETGDVLDAARFASCVGSFVVEGEGVQGIPCREDVMHRMERYVIPCREAPTGGSRRPRAV